jgi:hypothetical protein
LGDAIPGPDNKRLSLIEIEKNNADFVGIVGVDDTCTDIKTVLYGQS